MGCTVEELGSRLTAQEFGEWLVMFKSEEWHPSAERWRHAELLAATFTGPATRFDKQGWTASHFVPVSAWDALKAVVEFEEEPDIEAQVRRVNARIRSD